MKVSKATLICLASEGRTTLQVPDIALEWDGKNFTAGDALSGQESDAIECEPDWFVVLKTSGGRPAVGRESGFTFFTRKGYEACKEMLRAAFTTVRGSNWPDFEKAAEHHFQHTEKARLKYIKTLEGQLAQLRKMR